MIVCFRKLETSTKAETLVYSYLTCLALQTAAAFALLAAVRRAFRIVIDNPGVLHPLPPVELALLVAAICAFQAAYWYRLARIKIPNWRSIVLGHLLGFVSRLSFIFGAALFSLFFLRHAPELNSSEGALTLIPRIAILLATLFCLYCFALELERLGNQLQSPAPKGFSPVTGDPGDSRLPQAEGAPVSPEGEEPRSRR